MVVDKALFPLSGDPVTNGHLNIIERASRWVKELVVVVLENDLKLSVLSLEERVEILKSCICSQGIENVHVDAYDGLLSDYATRSGIFKIIRGIRNTDDLEYEIYLEYGHKRQNPHLEIIYLLADPQFRTISSSIAKSILHKGGQITEYVPLQAKRAMEEKLIGQYKLIVTGGIACGKSFVSERLMELLRDDGYSVHNIDFDHIVKNIYQTLACGKYQELSSQIIDYLGKSILTGGYISQQNISREVFAPSDPVNKKKNSQEKLKVLLGFLRPYINSLYHKELASRKGLILLNIPLAGETRMLHESNNQVLLISCTTKIQEKRLQNHRDIPLKEARLRIARAGTTYTKKKLIEKIISQDKFGKILLFKNHYNHSIPPKALADLKNDILQLFPQLHRDA